MTVKSEWLEADLINGKPVDIATLCQLSSTALRLSVRLGLERRAKQLPSLDQYLEHRTNNTEVINND